MVHLLIQENSPEAVKMLDFLKTQPYVEVLDAPNKITLKTFKDVESGKVSKPFNGVKNLMDALKS